DMCETLLNRARCDMYGWEFMEISQLIAQIANSLYYEAGITWENLVKFIDECTFSMRPLAFDIIRWCPILFLGQSEEFTRRLAEFIEIGCMEDEDWQIQSSALESFVALVNKSEAEDDERTASILQLTTIEFIVMARTEVETKSHRFTVLSYLKRMIASKQLLPHLPSILEFIRGNGEGLDGYTSTRTVRKIRHQIECNKVNIRCSSMADKSAFVADENLIDLPINEDLDVETDDHVFGKV
ncbi:hypothetical protein PMAYCL1PPCAC_18936, partial [Pristionchus mayeri]